MLNTQEMYHACVFFHAYFSYTTIHIFHKTFFGEVSHFGIKEALWIDVENEKLQIPGSFVKICQKKQKLKVVEALMNKQTNNMTVYVMMCWKMEIWHFWYSLDIYLTENTYFYILFFNACVLNAFFIKFLYCRF